MNVWSNAGEVIGDFGAWVEDMGPDDALGAELAEIIGGGMFNRCMRTVDPSGEPWKENAESTIRRKGHDIVGRGLTGEMLKREYFTSLWEVRGTTFHLVYAGPADKLRWFEGDNRYGIVRIAWGLDSQINRRVRHALDRHMQREYRRRGGTE